MHKLRWQDYGFFTVHPLPSLFLWYESWQKVDFLDHVPTLSCKGSLWTLPKLVSYKFAKDILLFNGEATNLLKIRWLLSEKASAYSPHLWLLSSYLYLGRRKLERGTQPLIHSGKHYQGAKSILIVKFKGSKKRKLHPNESFLSQPKGFQIVLQTWGN